MILVLDTETTSLGPDARVCEVAAVPLYPPANGTVVWTIGSPWSSLVDEGVGITPEASAVHHLTGGDLEGAPSLAVAVEDCKYFIWGGLSRDEWLRTESPDLWTCAAHNAAFDIGFLPMLNALPWICTYRCALHLYPDAPNHRNQTLRYYLGLTPELPDGLAPHRALYDAIVTAGILQRMLETKTVEELLELSVAPVLLRKVGFGKHKGQLWSDVPRDYCRWVASKGEFDKDTIYTANHWWNWNGV